MKYLLTTFLISLFIIGQAQQRPEAKPVSQDIINKIKTDVWIPFMESYRDLDSDKIKSIHSDDIIRITIDDNKVETGQAYKDNFGGFLEHMKSRGGEVAITFSVKSTAINETADMAYQTGYYQLRSKRGDDTELKVRGYGFFNVALKKKEGVWKLTLDSDKSVQIDQTEFDSGTVYTLDG